MHRGFIILLFFLAALISKPCYSQQLLFKTYAINDGLVHNVVRKIHQDSKGFLWIATWEGLSKYDGYRFTNYQGKNSLGNGMINDIVETKDGSIYITSNDGGIYRITNNGLPEKINTSNTIINKLVFLPNKTIALTDHNGIYEFREEKLFKPAQPSERGTYYNLAPVNDSLLLFQSDFSLQLLNNRYQLVAQQKETTPVYSECGFLKDSRNRMWVGTIAGLKLFSPTQYNGSIRFLDLPPPFNHPLLKTARISAIFEDAEGALWFGTGEGLLKIGADGLHQLLTEQNGLPANDVSCIYQDREKNIWIGGTRGVARLITSTSIRIFRTEDGLAFNSISHVLSLANGDVLTRSDNGTQLYKISTGRFEPATKNFYAADEKNNCFSVASHNSDNRYLVFQQRPFHFTFFSPNSIGEYYAYKDSAGNYFLHSFSGIIMSRDLKNWQKTLCHSDTRIVMLDTKGDLWAGTRDSGLLRISYQYSNGIPQVTEQKHFLPGISIRALYEDSKGNIWVGSRYNGVYCINKKGNTLHHFNQGSGLTSNRSASIAEDKNGAIWLNFYSGLDKLVPQNASFRVFNFSRFHNFFTNIQAMVVDNKHSLWLGTTQGLVNILDGGVENTEPLQTIITSAILGDSVHYHSTDEKINLSYRQNNLVFEFAAPGFINEKQLMYSYRLLGSQTVEWSRPSNEHAVSFASLSHGDYQFEVRTLGWNGNWGESAVFPFSIRPPFWLTWWFISAVTLLTGAVIFLLVKRRIKNIRRNAELKHKLAEAEMMALRSQMNPHFIFNCLNAIDNMIQTNQKEKATTYLNRFAKLIRGVLDSSKNNLVPLYKDVEILKLYLQLEQFRCNNQFDYNLQVEPSLLNGDYKVPPLIVQPFLENAIHHGLMNKETGSRCLEVSVQLVNDFVKYTIKDNGVGRTLANELKQMNKPEHQSYGIQISTDRIMMHNNSKASEAVLITDLYTDEKPAGTLIEVFVKADR